MSAELDRSYCASASGLVVERDLRTGQATGVVRDFQGGVDDLAVTQEGHELVAMSTAEVVGASYLGRWRLDGPGVGGRLLAAGAASTGGYSPDGRLVLASGARPGSTEVLDENGQSVLQVGVAGKATWLSSETIAVVGTDAVLVDVSSGDVRSAPALGPSTVVVHSEPPGRYAWAVTHDDDRWMVKRFDVATGTTTPTSMTLLNVDDVTAASDGRSLVVTAEARRPMGQLHPRCRRRHQLHR